MTDYYIYVGAHKAFGPYNREDALDIGATFAHHSPRERTEVIILATDVFMSSYYTDYEVREGYEKHIHDVNTLPSSMQDLIELRGAEL